MSLFLKIKEYFFSKIFSNVVFIGNYKELLKYFLFVVNFYVFFVMVVFFDKIIKLMV